MQSPIRSDQLSRTPYILLREEQAQGTDGGVFNSGSWITRVINTEVVDTGNNCSISSNQITLFPGTYHARISAPAFYVSRHQAILYNVTSGSVVLIGSSEISYAGDLTTTRSNVIGDFTIAVSSVFEVRHRCETGKTINGLGVSCNFTTEIYTIAEFWKVS